MTWFVLFTLMVLHGPDLAAQGDARVVQQADAHFQAGRYVEALPLYSQLVSLTPGDHALNYRYGTCLLHGGDREKAISHLKFAVQDPATPAQAWFWLGRAYHLNYRFAEAIAAYQHYRGVADRKALTEQPVDVWEKQCRNGQKLLSDLKDVVVHNKVETAESEFFRFYDLKDIGGRIVVMPDELKTPLDRKSKRRGLIYLPDRPGPIYFSSLGRDGRTGLDIYRTEVLPTGQFATPVKLAGFINTEYDEDFPFMHPDGRTFYFSSTGHNSMGGYDVFRAAYDPGMDAFGRPENLDFAINTPDDELLYIVDADHQEACFASARSSKQGHLHVYRVSTKATPVTITILQGTYLNGFDANDRKARIVVEDATTHERVAEVRTDLNGGYILALPRTGRFRFMVDCGPSGRTHLGQVDVPAANGPAAYRQELELSRQGDMERLVIRNHFDAPLDGDIIALAMDEIRRRAALDVSTPEEIASARQEEPAATDLMTRAGFTGDVTVDKARQMAHEQVATLEQRASESQRMAGQAWTMALDAMSASEQATKAAAQAVQQAEAVNDPEVRDLHMGEAAAYRQQARAASLRARAARQAALDLEAEGTSLTQKTVAARQRAIAMDAALKAGDEEAALPHLVALREELQARSGPNAEVDIAERVRRAATEKEREAARQLQLANASSGEENELADRLRRMRLERDETRSKSRRDQLDKDIAVLEGQAQALEQETRAAFQKAQRTQNDAAVVRGESALIAHLEAEGRQHAVTKVSAADADALAQRITATDAQLAALPIDERMEALVQIPVTELQVRTFDWRLPALEAAPLRTPTRAMATDGLAMHTPTTTPSARDSDDEPNALRTREAGQGRTVEPAGPLQARSGVTPPVSSGEETVAASSLTGLTEATEDGADGAQQAPLPPTQAERAVEIAPDRARITPDPTPTIAVNDGMAELQDTTRFFLENRIAELRQMAVAERNRTEREALEKELHQLEERLAALVRSEEPVVRTTDDPLDALRDEIGAVEVQPGRMPMVITPATKDEEIIDRLHSSYATFKANLARNPDADERASALQGLELMLADSIQAEMALQVAVLELDPAQAPVVLPRVDRLRRLRAEHLRLAEEHVQQRQAELAALAPAAASTTGAPAAAQSPGHDPVRDRFVALDPDPQRVYASRLVHRSPQVDKAMAEQEKEMERATGLRVKADSLAQAASGLPRKQFDKLVREADRLRDERLILLTDLGQRSAFITRTEWRTATDSLKALERAVGTKGLSPSEPLQLMARQMKSEAERSYAEAGRIRKQADRSEDILLRDSLYRKAYALELEALREVDRAITVVNALLHADHVRGSSMTYEAVAARVLGIAATPPPALAQEVAVAPPPAPPAPQPTRATEVPQEQPRGDVADEPAPVVAQEVPAPAPAAASEPVTDPTGDAATRARHAAEQEADRAIEEARIDPAVLARLERMLAPEELHLSPLPLDQAEPDLLRQRRDRANTEAAAMERQALEFADLADRYTDSLSTARKRDRERLERLAVRARTSSDSLMARSVLLKAEAVQAEEDRAKAEEVREFVSRMREFYYLTADEQQLVVNNTDASRYFHAKTRAMEQHRAADEAQEAAKATRELAASLTAALPSGRPANDAQRVRAEVLRARASALEARADSLDNVAARLRSAAALNEGQAAALLQSIQGMEPSELMALEMRTRRIDPLLAEAHGQAGPERQPLPASARQASNTGDAPLVAAGGDDMTDRRATDEGLTPLLPRTTERAESGMTPVSPRPPTALLEVLRDDRFEVRATPVRRAEPVAIDAPMPAGLVFKVQIGAFRRPIPMDAFSDLDPVAGESLDNGVVRYTAGMFTRLDHANAARDKVRDRGYRDAFVVAYLDGRRIPIGQARAMQQGGGEAQAVTQSRTPGQPTAQAQGPITPAPATPRPVTPAPEVTITTPVPSPAPADDAALLRNYPSSAEELVATFAPSPEATSYYNVPGAAPARQVEAIRGLFFTVQVGVYSRPVALERLFNITPLNTERLANGQIRYTTGMYTNLDQARAGRERMVERGVKDAFITAYLNGKRIPMAEADALLRKFGASILAQP